MKSNKKRIFFLIFLLFLGTSLFGKVDKNIEFKTIVIDAGHGGHDSGAISRDRTHTKEKDLTLSVAKYFKKYLKQKYPNLKIILTRDKDVFVELSERANIANKNNADLFISIHINSVMVPRGRSWAKPSGFSVHCLGQSSRKGNDLFSKNWDLCKRENSVILLEDDQTKYQGFDPREPESYIFFSLLQNANLGQSLSFASKVNTELIKTGPIRHSRGLSQDPFWVLWRTTMPAVLVELGFITNKTALSALRSTNGKTKIALALVKAVEKFKLEYDKSMEIKSENNQDDLIKDSYALQVLTSTKKISTKHRFFKGEKITIIKKGRYYKYLIIFSSKNQLNKKYFTLKKKFSDSFKVRIQNNEIYRL